MGILSFGLGKKAKYLLSRVKLDVFTPQATTGLIMYSRLGIGLNKKTLCVKHYQKQQYIGNGYLWEIKLKFLGYFWWGRGIIRPQILT